MADDLHYIPGQFYRICDQTGFKIRNTRTKKQWNNYIVRRESWEARHPQDLVKGIADYQLVSEPRPRPNPLYNFVSSSLESLALPGQNAIYLQSVVGFNIKDQISLILDNKETLITWILSVNTTLNQLGLLATLPYSASQGNLVTDLTSTSGSSQNFPYRNVSVDVGGDSG